MYDLTTLEVIKCAYWEAPAKIKELAEQGYILASPLPTEVDKNYALVVWMAKPQNDKYRGSDVFGGELLNKGSCLGTP